MCVVTVCRFETLVLDSFLFFFDKKSRRAVWDLDHGSRHRHTVTVYLVLVCSSCLHRTCCRRSVIVL